MLEKRIKNLIEELRNDQKPQVKISRVITKKNTVYVIGKDRSDKSAIIGGGEVVGKLRNKVSFDQVTVLSELDLKLRNIILSRNIDILEKKLEDNVIKELKKRLIDLIKLEKDYPNKNLKKSKTKKPMIGTSEIIPNPFQGLDFYLSKKIGLKPDLNSEGIIKFGNFNKMIKLNPLRINLRYLFWLSWFRSFELGKKTSKNVKSSKIENTLNEVYLGLAEPAQGERKISSQLILNDIPFNKIFEDKINKKTKNYRLNESIKILNSIKTTNKSQKGIIDKVLKPLLNIRKENEDPLSLLDFSKNKVSIKPIIAYSGGVDSSSTLKIMNNLTDPIAVTVGKEIKPLEDIENIILDRDSEWNKIKKGILKNKSHPCGKCSRYIEDKIYEYSKENKNKIVIFGDMISHGSHSVYMDDDVLRINLPALLFLTKQENYKITNKTIEDDLEYGCSLLNKLHNLNNSNQKLSIRRVLRELRARVIDPEYSKALIKDIQN